MEQSFFDILLSIRYRCRHKANITQTMSIRSFHVSGYFTTVKPIDAGFFITSETSPDSCASTDEVALHTQHWSHAMGYRIMGDANDFALHLDDFGLDITQNTKI